LSLPVWFQILHILMVLLSDQGAEDKGSGACNCLTDSASPAWIVCERAGGSAERGWDWEGECTVWRPTCHDPGEWWWVMMQCRECAHSDSSWYRILICFRLKQSRNKPKWKLQIFKLSSRYSWYSWDCWDCHL
jgi:hypothetical protein